MRHGESKTGRRPDKRMLGRIKEEMAMPRVAKSSRDKIMKRRPVRAH
jgi:hypothetical protein